MPRKRKGEIRESLAELLELEQRHRKNHSAIGRLRMLRLLHEHPGMELADVARGIKYSQQTVKRWLKIYRESGIDALLNVRAVDGGGERQSPELEDLRAGIAEGRITTREDVMGWLGRSVGRRSDSVENTATISNKGIRHGAEIADGEGVAEPNAIVESSKLIAFLNALPVSRDPVRWINEMRVALAVMLGDVDRITMMVNMDCDLENPETYNPDLAFSQHGNIEYEEFYKVSHREEGDHIDRMLKMLEKMDFPFAEYRPARAFVYYFDGSAYLGVISLWREIGKPEISQRSLDMMRTLYPFIVFLFSDLVVRHRSDRPVGVFLDSLKKMSGAVHLTPQELKIIALQLIGMSYNDMAETLHISPHTLRYHMRSIYRKTGTHSQAELFAKYFTPGRFASNK